jgi:hypothetical protein
LQRRFAQQGNKAAHALMKRVRQRVEVPKREKTSLAGDLFMGVLKTICSRFSRDTISISRRPPARKFRLFLFLFAPFRSMLLVRSIIVHASQEVSMSSYLFPTNLSRVFPSSDIEIIKRDAEENPIAVCLTTHNPGDRAIAQVLLEGNTDSFALFDGARYFADGTVVPCDPARPASVAELHLAFDVETVEFTWPGPRPRVYIFTHTLQEWEDAKAAMRHLVAQKLLSPRSYLEGDHTGEDQGLSAQNLDALPHRAGMVAMFREAAYCTQNDLYEKEAYDEEDAEGGWPDEKEGERDDSWRDEWDEEDEDEEDDPWEEEPDEGEEDEDAQQACRDNRDEEPADGAIAGAEANGAFVGVRSPLRGRVRTLFSRGLDWRQALARYAPRIVV